MRLTEHMIIARSKESDLSAIKRINLWGCDLTDISVIKNMTNIEVLALSVNNLSCLEPLESCTKLQELYLRKNNIQDFKQLLHLRNLPSLTHLWLAENPCCVDAGTSYRACVVKMLPNLKKLDEELITSEDVEQANRLDYLTSEVAELVTMNTTTAKEPRLQQQHQQQHQTLEAEPNLLQSPNTDHQQLNSKYGMTNTMETFQKQQVLQTPRQQSQSSYVVKTFHMDESPTGNQMLILDATQQMNGVQSEQVQHQHLMQKLQPPNQTMIMSQTPRIENKSFIEQETQQLSRAQSLTQISQPHSMMQTQMQSSPILQQTPIMQSDQQSPQSQTPLELVQSYELDSTMQSPYKSQQMNYPPAAMQQFTNQQTWLQQQQQQQQHQEAIPQHGLRASSSSMQQQIKSSTQQHQQQHQHHQQLVFSSQNNNNRWRDSNVDYSSSNEMELPLNISRSFSMQTINEHPEWDEQQQQQCNSQRYPNPHRNSTMETSRHGNNNHNKKCDNFSDSEENLSGSVTTRAGVENCWDKSARSSKTRLSHGPPREMVWENSSRVSRARSSQGLQREPNMEDGSQTNRSRYSHGPNHDMAWEDGLCTNRSGASKAYSSNTTTTLPSQNPRRRNANVLSALLCIVPELDVESLQVLEHSIQCRLDELTSD